MSMHQIEFHIYIPKFNVKGPHYRNLTAQDLNMSLPLSLGLDA